MSEKPTQDDIMTALQLGPCNLETLQERLACGGLPSQAFLRGELGALSEKQQVTRTAVGLWAIQWKK